MNANNSTKIFSWKTAILLCLGVGLLSAGLSVFLQANSQPFQSLPLKDLDFVPLPSAAVASFGSSFEAPAGQPDRLIIPAIGVDAVIQSVGLTSTGNMDIPTNFTDVAWYNQGAIPGMPGSAVISGHLDGKNVPEAVFYNLKSLAPGDLIEILDKNGRTIQFEVVGSKIYNYNDPTSEIFSPDASKARLILITCAGDWIKDQKLYDKRIVIFSELITVE